MVALIGASGSGKSTLLRHIAGFLPADAGAIEVFGRVAQRDGHIAGNIRELRADLGFVFQQFNLVNLLARFNRAEREAALTELAAVGIAEQAYQRAGTLSGGQQQRAALARTLVQRARIILADEPIASLDPESSRNVMDILSRINRERGLTVLVSLHQIDFALRYCPRTIALHQGRVVYDGPSKNLDPATLRRIYGAAAEELLAPAIALPTRETTAFAGLAAAQAAA